MLAELTPSEEWLQRFPPKTVGLLGCYPPCRGLSPPHHTLLPCSSAEIRPSGAPQTPGDDVRPRLVGRRYPAQGRWAPAPRPAFRSRTGDCSVSVISHLGLSARAIRRHDSCLFQFLFDGPRAGPSPPKRCSTVGVVRRPACGVSP